MDDLRGRRAMKIGRLQGCDIDIDGVPGRTSMFRPGTRIRAGTPETVTPLITFDNTTLHALTTTSSPIAAWQSSFAPAPK